MIIVLNCPGCKKKYEIDGGLAGKRSRCRDCGEIFRIPVPSGRVVEPARPGATTAVPSVSRPPVASSTPPVAAPPPEMIWQVTPVASLLDEAPTLPASPPAASQAPPASPALRPYAAGPTVQPALPPRVSKTASPALDEELPPPPRALYRPSKRRNAARDADSASDLGVTAMGWFFLIDAVATLIMYSYFTAFDPSPTLRVYVHNFSQGVLAVAAFSLALWGVIWLLCMAFAESVIQGCLCLFVPFYALFFSLSRWSERRGAFGLTLAPFAMVLITLVIGMGAVGMKKVNDGLYGTTDSPNDPVAGNPGTRAVPATPAGDPKPSVSWFDGGTAKKITANAASVRRAEEAIRTNVTAIRQVTSISSQIHDANSARANLGAAINATRVLEIVENRASFVKVGENEMIALKHSVGGELRSSLSELKQEFIRISGLLQIPAHVRDDATARLDRAIEKWIIKPGEETAPTLVEEPTPFDPFAPNGSVSISPDRQDRMMDDLKAQYHNVRQEYGDRVVTVVVSGMPGNGDPSKGVTNRDVTEAISGRLKELAPEVRSSQMFGANDRMSIVLAPVNDPQGLVTGIDFGTVTLNGDRIEVRLDPRYVSKVPRLPAESRPAPRIASKESPARPPDPEVPVGADAITRSLIELKSSEAHKRKQALDRLQRSAPDGRVDQVVQSVAPMLEDDDGFLASDAVKVLAVWRSPEALTALIGRTRDNRHFVRSDAIKALARYPDRQAAEAVVAVYKEDGFAVEAALKEMGPAAEPAVIPLLRSPDPELRRKACEVLKFIGGQETLRTMLSLPRDPDFGVQMAAREAASAIVARVGPLPKPARNARGGTGNGSRN